MIENIKNALTDDELTQVSGGGAERSGIYEGVTSMRCDFCGYTPSWAGDYMGQTLDCPGCGRHEFHGDYWIHYT